MTFEEFLCEWRDDNEYITAKTSGSTGVPKEIRLGKDFVAQSGNRTNDYFEINEKSRLHSCVAADFIGGKMMAVRAELAGCRLTWETPSNTPLKEIDKKEIIDLLAVVPSQMLHILDHQERLPLIRNIIIGGSPVHPELRRKICESGLNCHETYGMTETASHIALRRITMNPEPFRVLPGIRVKRNEEGCLSIEFEGGPGIETNDLAEIISPGRFYISGRKDNIIISGGKKINPIEIEEIIGGYFKGTFYLWGEADEKWGRKLIMTVEGQPDPHTERNLKEIFESRLEGWQRPKEIRWKDVLLRTDSGKIIR